MAQDALIGTGFVGSILREQRRFDVVYNSKNIEEMRGGVFGDVWCAGLPGTKWVADAHPFQDMASVCHLIDVLKTTKVECFTLISTVDVLGIPASGDEDTKCNPIGNYGKNRLHFEKFVSINFPSYLIVRLPGIVGGNPTKGPLFDLKHNHEVEKLNANSLYQWYPARHLDKDCFWAWERGIKLLHLVTPPISLSDLCLEIPGYEDIPYQMKGKLQAYDVTTKYGDSEYGGYTRHIPLGDISDYLGVR